MKTGGAGWTAIALLMTTGVAVGAEKEPSTSEKAAEMAVRKMLNASGGSIDQCAQRYLLEQPGAKGQARIDVKVRADGKAIEPVVQTGLKQARTLRLCLEAVAKTWRFPKPRGPTPLGITIVVAEGVKFRVPAPGEKPPDRKPEEKEPQGFLRLLPGTFLPYGGPSED